MSGRTTILEQEAGKSPPSVPPPASLLLHFHFHLHLPHVHPTNWGKHVHLGRCRSHSSLTSPRPQGRFVLSVSPGWSCWGCGVSAGAASRSLPHLHHCQFRRSKPRYQVEMSIHWLWRSGYYDGLHVRVHGGSWGVTWHAKQRGTLCLCGEMGHGSQAPRTENQQAPCKQVEG